MPRAAAGIVVGLEGERIGMTQPSNQSRPPDKRVCVRSTPGSSPMRTKGGSGLDRCASGAIRPEILPCLKSALDESSAVQCAASLFVLYRLIALPVAYAV